MSNLKQQYSFDNIISFQDTQRIKDYHKGRQDLKEEILEILDKYRNSVGVKYALEEIEKL